KLRHQNAPRHPVNRKMMDAQQQTTRPMRAGIKPHRLHHHPARRRKPALRRTRLLADARLTRPSIKITNVDPSDAARRTHRPNRPPPPAPSPPPHPPPAADAMHRDDQAQPAAPKSDQPRASPPAPAAASPD